MIVSIIYLYIFTLLIKLSLQQQNQISYFGFISNQHAKNLSGETAIQLQIMETDDSPFVQLNLPFEFNFLGINVKEIFLNANGAVHYSYVQPCPPLNYFAVAQDTFNKTYYNVISGYLTDLDPSKSRDGLITYTVNQEAVTINFQNIPYYNSTLEQSFQIILYKDNHIEIDYQKIIKSEILPQENFWASGLRGGNMNDYVYFTPEQVNFALAEWGTTVPGISPRQDEVKSGNKFTICPVAREWCVTPSSLIHNGTHIVVSTLNMSTVLLSCATTVEYGVILYNHTLSYTIASVPCRIDGNSTTLYCSIPALPYASTSGGVFVQPAWRNITTSLFTPLPVEPMQLNVTGSDSQHGVAACANNPASDQYCGAASCGICNGNYSCLHLPCVNTTDTMEVTNTATSGIYERVTCMNNTCPVYASNDMYYIDYTTAAVCCQLSEMDCAGKCSGTAAVARDHSGAVYCCEDVSKIDCRGVCEGTAQRDICGVCEGNDFNGLTCFDTSDIIVATGAADGGLYPIYDVTTNTSTGLVRTVAVNITNKSKFQITASMIEISPNIANAPVINVPTSIYIIPINTTTSIKITTSIESLYTGSMPIWMTKTLQLRYYRDIYPSLLYMTSIPIYLSSMQCSEVRNMDTCMRLPGCIYCFTSSKMRILRENNNSISSNSSNSNSNGDTTLLLNTSSNSQLRMRQLFIEVIPETLSDEGQSLLGVCGDGWTNQDCAVIAPEAFVSAAGKRPYTSVMDSVVVLAVLYYIAQ